MPTNNWPLRQNTGGRHALLFPTPVMVSRKLLFK
jgi:hypothetical protein